MRVLRAMTFLLAQYDLLVFLPGSCNSSVNNFLANAEIYLSSANVAPALNSVIRSFSCKALASASCTRRC